MENSDERRTEQRLRYYWPIWFAENPDHNLTQGQMVDVSSNGASFNCYADQECPHLGQNITTRFSVPKYGCDDSFDIADFTRSGHVCRIDCINPFMRRIAIQFGNPLPFKPGEQIEAQAAAY